jgi:hypothetical protein
MLARITSCRSIADCDRLPWQAPGRSTGLLHYPAQHRRPPRRRPILEVLGSRIEGEQLLEQPVGGSQLKSRCAPGLVPDDIAAVEQIVEQRSGLSARIKRQSGDGHGLIVMRSRPSTLRNHK